MGGTIKSGDYVQYKGNFSVTGPLHDPGIGQIKDFHTPFEDERIYLYLQDRDSHIWCDYRDINMIETGEEHLLRLGFSKVQVGKNIKYELLGLTISQTVFMVTPYNYIATGLCVCDFSNPKHINWKKYISDGDFSMSAFYKDFPYVGNINRLLDYWENSSRVVNREKIVFGN